jgi:hypothetical protein
MDAHTVTVIFDDEKTAAADVIAALGQAGYSVPEHQLVE